MTDPVIIQPAIIHGTDPDAIAQTIGHIDELYRRCDDLLGRIQTLERKAQEAVWGNMGDDL